MSMMKSSGSKRINVLNGEYSTERHLQNTYNFEDLPTHESIKSTRQFYNGKINFGPLVRFLRGSIGKDWSQVYSEILNRIPTKLLGYKEMIFWFVADKVEIIDNKPWNKKSQQFIWVEGPYSLGHHTDPKSTREEFKEFYVDPTTNKLIHIPQKSFKRLAKKK